MVLLPNVLTSAGKSLQKTLALHKREGWDGESSGNFIAVFMLLYFGFEMVVAYWEWVGESKKL